MQQKRACFSSITVGYGFEQALEQIWGQFYQVPYSHGVTTVAHGLLQLQGVNQM